MDGVRWAATFLSSWAVLGIATAEAQKYRPDDPLGRDPDDLHIQRPAVFELSPTFDLIENTFGSEAGPATRATNINTVGEVPDSSWFTNRIGLGRLSAADIALGGPGPAKGLLIIEEALLLSTTSGIVVRDRDGRRFLLRFDPVGMPSLATGAQVIASQLLWACGYNVLPSSITTVLPETLRIAPGALLRQRLGASSQQVDEEFLQLLFEDSHANIDGSYRASASLLPEGDWVGQFRFYGTRSDDANDIFRHENRRELRGLAVFAAWLNHTYSGAVNTVDYYVTDNGRSFLRHYLFDFASALGSGYDLEGQLAFKQRRSGYDYDYWGDFGDAFKTALSLGLWERPWMRISYPVESLPEVGRIEASHFEPGQWKPEYPNAAFERLLPDDALWAADILLHFDEDVLREVVAAADYLNPEATRYLADVLIERRAKLVRYYLSRTNPIGHFAAAGTTLAFHNPGADRGLADDSLYQYQWFRFDNMTGALTTLTARRYTAATSIQIPADGSDYLAVRIRTRSRQQPEWRRRVQVVLRRQGDSRQVVGVERETGVLDDDPVAVNPASPAPGGVFGALSDEQQDLVLEWLADPGGPVNPERAYDVLPLSVRTTFEAVTQALGQTRLHDADGRLLIDGLDLIESLEAVAGEELAPGEDLFRLFVRMAPDAIRTLQSSREFERSDNLMGPAGYPTEYRESAGYPTIRIAVSTDGRRGAIDIQYRSAELPADLLNGRRYGLRSDIRAGENHERHISRWQQLPVWWEGLFGMPLTGEEPVEAPPPDRVPPVPRRGSGDLATAVGDFLRAWLIERQPAEAAPYFSPQAYSCLPDFGGARVDYQLAPLLVVDRMNSALANLPAVRNLGEVSRGVRLTDPRLRVIDHDRHAQFVLLDMPADMAARLDCQQRGRPVPVSGREAAYGRYFAASFVLSRGAVGSGRVLLVWQKQGGQWRIVSYRVRSGREATAPPDLRPPAAPARLERVQGEADLLQANARFVGALTAQDFETAMSLVAQESSACASTHPAAAAEAAASLEDGLRQMTAAVEAAGFLEALRPVAFTHPALKIVAHPHEDRFQIATIPDPLAAAVRCETVGAAGPFYVSALQLRTRGWRAATLVLLWSRQSDGNWRIVSYRVD